MSARQCICKVLRNVKVLSIPAGNSLAKVINYRIYEYPEHYSPRHKKTPFITFRAGNGGEMSVLYSVDMEVMYNPVTEPGFLNNFDGLSESQTERVRQYNEETDFPEVLNHRKRYWVLSENVIDLPLLPHPRKNNANRAYYSLFDLLTKKIVTPAKLD